MASGELEVQKTLEAIMERFASANRRAAEVAGLADETSVAGRVDAQRDAEAAALEFWAFSSELGETFLMLLRHAADKQPENLRSMLMDIIAPDLTLFVEGFLSERR